jgi:hypothetical protein
MESARIPAKEGTLPEISPPTPHIVLLLSTIFCVMGGALLLASGTLAWIVELSGSGAAWSPERAWYFTDLYGYGGAYSWIFAIMIGGAMIIAFSLFCLLTEKAHHKEIWPLACFLTSLATTFIAAVVLIWISGDLRSIAENAMLGPAPYLAVFGCVLDIAGGSILFLNTLQHEHFFRFRARPTPMLAFGDKKRQYGSFEETVTDRICPGCQSPVKSNWQICPVCGRVLR